MFDERSRSRRAFLGSTLACIASLSLGIAARASNPPVRFAGKDVFDRIVRKSNSENWATLPIGELIGKIAIELQGTPYVAHTLELSANEEICSVNLRAVDCVTFIELSLAFARMLKKGAPSPSQLLSEVAFIRYRGGVPGDYSTRLHYTSDWFLDNEDKHVLQILTNLPGMEVFSPHVNFMSNHVQSYKQLVANPSLVPKVKAHENELNNKTLRFVPLENISAVEPLLRTGDIVGVCTNIPGLDIVHTGLVLRTTDGIAHFMDASSLKKQMKVTIEPGPISKALKWSNTLTGAVFARAREPRVT